MGDAHADAGKHTRLYMGVFVALFVGTILTVVVAQFHFSDVGNVVVVSHVSPMKAAVAWALEVGIGISWNCHLDHASVCRISFRGRHPLLQTFNETVELD